MSKKVRQIKAGGRSGDKKVIPLNLRVSGSEKAAFDRAADVAGLGLSAWIRERLRSAAMRELDNIGEKAPFIKAPN